MTPRRAMGFSLVELLVGLSIVVILAAIAAPSFQQLISSTRMTSQSNEFLTALNFTRSEAVKRNTRVTMCKSSDGATCSTTGNWQQGWIIFVDPAGSGTIGVVDYGETVLRVHPALSGGSTLVGSTPVASSVSYIASGQTTQSGHWDLCGPVTSMTGRDMDVSAGSGRASAVKDEPPVTCS